MRESRHRLLQGDAADLSFLKDSSVACIVTSPPYPMIEMWDDLFCARNPDIRGSLDAGDGPRAFALMHADLDRAWREMHRVLIDGGWACVNIGDATRTTGGRFRLFPNHARILSACAALGFDILPAVLWRKQTNAPNKFMGSGMLPAGAYVTLEHEHILLMRKGAARRFSSSEERETRRRSAIFWEERNTWYSDLWDFKGARQGRPNGVSRERSAAFPFELPYRLINMYSVRGDMVLDPFVGTGKTILAAMASGRDSVGVDVDAGLLAEAAAEARNAAPFLNELCEARAAGHARFVEEHCREKGPLGHVNKPHGFPVMTLQEEELRLSYVESVCPLEDGSLRVSYRS
jgi:DNA modification methylase